MNWQVISGRSEQALKDIADNSIDAVITDPPYGINFLGKNWDSNTGEPLIYQECLRVLKPGGHLLAFSAARTYHHLARAVETAGFEIRDQIMWIYGSGFPKSQDIGRQIQKSLGVKETRDLSAWENGTSRLSFDNTGKKLADSQPSQQVVVTDPLALAWQGWGTNLKPAHEPIVVARKPLGEKNIPLNCQRWGVGALNIDDCRVAYLESENIDLNPRKAGVGVQKYASGDDFAGDTSPLDLAQGQFYAQASPLGRFPSNVIGEITPDHQKYFYCPKVNSAERNVGCGQITPRSVINDGRQKTCDNAYQRGATVASNNHPTVKPVALMSYLIKLVTRPGATVLDPFTGSGSTGMAAVELGRNFVGIEQDSKYADIARARITAWAQQHPALDPEIWQVEE